MGVEFEKKIEYYMSETAILSFHFQTFSQTKLQQHSTNSIPLSPITKIQSHSPIFS